MCGPPHLSPAMPHKIFIDGAAGTTGLEIADRLKSRDEFDLLTLDDTLRKDSEARREALNDADVAILCLPDDAARDAVSLLNPGNGTRVIDASSAHRTAQGWCYGFPELMGRERVADARRISNPGCYPTGFLGLIAPLVRENLLPADWPYTVHAVSGYSGGGKQLIARFEDDAAPAFRSYGFDLSHKHLPEMQAHANLEHSVIFSPAVVPAYRGMIVEVPLHLAAMENAPSAASLRAALQEFYADAPLVTVDDAAPVQEMLLETNAVPQDSMELHVFADPQGTMARLVARLDNLGKGASGAAVQNLNLLCGLEETAGLELAHS